MKHCCSGIYDAFEKVRVGNLWPEKQDVWFDYHDGYHEKENPDETLAFTIRTSLGQAGVHRAHFLNQLVGLFPKEMSHFGKRLERLEKEGKSGRWKMKFEDGSCAVADAVIGCDGIKSRVRQLMFGEDHPCAKPTYTHKYAYRSLTSMEEAVKAVGEEKAKNACMHVSAFALHNPDERFTVLMFLQMGPGGHMLTFPVNHGKTLNVVAFKTNPDDWPDHEHLTRPAKREDALRDFEGYGHDVISLLNLCKPELDCWAIFHLADNPVPTFAKGSVCLIGDAAHATSPHHGAGAGFCIEDAAILADLLADKRVKTAKDLEAAFATFDEVRRDRGQWLPPSSQHIGNCYEWIAEGVGEDFEKIEREINIRNSIVADVDVPGMCKEAQDRLSSRLQYQGRL